MSERRQLPQSPGLNLNDVYHVLFRHKWKILAIWSLGLAAAVGLWFKSPPIFKSQAKLLISYVVEAQGLNPAGVGDANIKVPSTSGDGVINAEVEILKSYDLALDVADAVGPEKILASTGGGSDRQSAAGVINDGIIVDAPRSSGGVISVIFQNKDRTIVQPVLEQLIESYRRKHVEAHNGPGTRDDFLIQQADQSRTQLAQTEQALRELKSKAGINSLDETKKEQAETISRIRKELYEAQIQLAGESAMTTRATQQTSIKIAETNRVTADVAPPDVLGNYRRVCSLLDSLEKQRLQLESAFTPESLLVKGIQENISKNESLKADLEKQYPSLTGAGLILTSERGPESSRTLELADRKNRIKALEAEIELHQQKLSDLGKEIAKVNEVEGAILELQRKRDLLEQNYEYFQKRLERAHFDEALGPGRISNINPIQRPSPPYKDVSKLEKKLILLVVGSLGFGVALAFGLELYIDRSFKRPIEVETRLGLPLFLSIPRFRLRDKTDLIGASSSRLLAQGNKDQSNPAAAIETIAVAPWKQNEHLRPFFQGLRDRLLMSFELRNLTHNPKLVAVTGCGSRSGISTIASGLAASLSETGEGNVLLVDMNNVGQGAAHFFRRGKLECGLDEALEREKRGSAMVQENLYVVAENTGNETLPRVLHKRFSSLLPRLKASDYDYIIFDMPPVDQLSPTSKLARYMDMVFMVVEAEKTDRDAVERATALLQESTAHVGIVLNKTQDYVPKRLRHGA